MIKERSTVFDPFTVQIHVKTSFYVKDGWLKILKPVTLEFTIFREKIRILSGRPLKQLRKSPKKRISGLQRDSNPWPLR